MKNVFAGKIGRDADPRLAAALERLDSNRPVYLEAESNKIGDIAIPPQLWDAMRRAPRAVIEAPRTARAEFLRTAYGDLLDDPEVLASKVTALGPYHAKTQIEAWHAMAASGDYAALAEGLIEHHYDPRYARSEAQRPAACRLELADISLDALTRAAEKLIAKRIL